MDSMVLLILKLDQLDQDIENALSESSSPSGTLTQPQKPIPDSESLPGGAVDIITLNNQQMNIPSPALPPLLYGADKSFPVPMAGSGAKPKTGDGSDKAVEFLSSLLPQSNLNFQPIKVHAVGKSKQQ